MGPGFDELDYCYNLLSRTVLAHQHPVTGLVPADGSSRQSDAWVRDNVYCSVGVWALSLAYQKRSDTDEGRTKAYELGQSTVKLMRALLCAMMRQVDKVEAFKKHPSPENALHAKYNVCTGSTVVGDFEWGHLQVDATSIFLLMLAQMTASGLQIVYTLDEVDFVQNLVFYIEAAYRTPDYGIWERGDKTNQGLPELNTSSIGLAKAALSALDDMDLFGARGGPGSVIHVLSDETQRCKAMVHSLVPRGSLSKELDASVLMAIGYPAFAVEDEQLAEDCYGRLVDKLEGRYGLKRFLRDGYMTAREDPGRLYYNPAELKQFENIECEWPVFYCFILLYNFFRKRMDLVQQYRDKLEHVIIKNNDGLPIVPELYTVAHDRVELECKRPHSQERKPAGKKMALWAQSLYVLTVLVDKGYVAVGEIDPVNRRLSREVWPDVVVQVALMAEDEEVQEELARHDVPSDLASQLKSVIVLPARKLSQVYERLGRNQKLKLSGRPDRSIGIIGTSKLYRVRNTIFAFMPQFLDQEQFYLCLDIQMLVDMIDTELAYLRANWRVLGRPMLTLPVTHQMLQAHTRRRYSGAKPLHPQHSPMMQLIEKFKSGFANGVRILLGRMEDFTSTSCVRQMDFLETENPADRVTRIPSSASLESLAPASSDALLLQPSSPRRISIVRSDGTTGKVGRRPSSLSKNVIGAMRRSRRTMKVEAESPLGSSSPVDLLASPIGIDPILISRPFSPARRTSAFSQHVAAPKGSLPTFSPSVGGMTPEELVQQLKEADSLEEQAEVLHVLFLATRPDYPISFYGEGCTVTDMLEEVYNQAGQVQQWAIVRHMAGLLNKHVDQLAEAAADLLVQQKQFTFGLPPSFREVTINTPLPSEEIKQHIFHVYGEDVGGAVLAQELVIYLAMLIRSEPQLFQSMLRLRICLIIRVMASELARKTKSRMEDASDCLMSLSPSEMKSLLHFILSGKEFQVEDNNVHQLSIVAASHKQQPSAVLQLQQDISGEDFSLDGGTAGQLLLQADELELDTYRHGQWQRRRQLDGALNRVPVNFYQKVWKVLDKSDGISIDGLLLPKHPTTNEMTAGELKFALEVESKLNRLPQPEYRQLMVEALMVLAIVAEHDEAQSLGGVLGLDEIIREANHLFLKEQLVFSGDATQCCAVSTGLQFGSCNAPQKICQHFYDSAPSGRYGTMSYLSQAVISRLRHYPRTDDNMATTNSSNVENSPPDCMIS